MWAFFLFEGIRETHEGFRIGFCIPAGRAALEVPMQTNFEPIVV